MSHDSFVQLLGLSSFTSSRVSHTNLCCIYNMVYIVTFVCKTSSLRLDAMFVRSARILRKRKCTADEEEIITAFSKQQKEKPHQVC